MALGAVSGIMALRAGLRVVERLDRMDFAEIRAMTTWDVTRPVIRNFQISIDAAAFVTVETELLVMTIHAVLVGPTGKEAVFPQLVRAMSRRDARALVAFCALF
jgi:hypothetical protein